MLFVLQQVPFDAITDGGVLHYSGILLQSRQRFDEAMHSYWTAIQFRPRLAGK
jgi:hypothetical protein